VSGEGAGIEAGQDFGADKIGQTTGTVGTRRLLSSCHIRPG
jgi:hypothetical protein